MDKILIDKAPKLLKDYLFYTETVKGRSSKTVLGYYTDLMLFLRYIYCQTNSVDLNCIQEVDISKMDNELICSISVSDVYAFINYAISERQNSSNTRARKVSCIRTFYNYLSTKTTYLDIDPVKTLETPSVKKTVPKFLSLEESLELLNSVETSHSERDYCMITLMINCGMRVSELCGINMSDIRFKEKTLRLLGKGNKERIIYINDACINSIEDYLKVRKQPEGQIEKTALFLSKQGKRITTRRVEQIVEDCLQAAGLAGRGYSPHKLRHTAATLMYQHGGADIRILKDILGHANVATTEIYTHTSSEQMKKAAENSPLAKVGRNRKKRL